MRPQHTLAGWRTPCGKPRAIVTPGLACSAHRYPCRRRPGCCCYPPVLPLLAFDRRSRSRHLPAPVCQKGRGRPLLPHATQTHPSPMHCAQPARAGFEGAPAVAVCLPSLPSMVVFRLTNGAKALQYGLRPPPRLGGPRSGVCPPGAAKRHQATSSPHPACFAGPPPPKPATRPRRAASASFGRHFPPPPMLLHPLPPLFLAGASASITLNGVFCTQTLCAMRAACSVRWAS